jgi:cell division protein FtsI (penicillin-binding protein 3)
MYDHYTRLGFGRKTGIAFPGEHPGFVNHPDNWSKQSIISLSYGYEILATILQLACAFCIIANNGYPVTPTLELTQQPYGKAGLPLYDTEPLETIKSILEHTTEHGTSKRAHINGYRIMSKTGTAILLIDGVYVDKKNLFTCSGIVEKGDYKRVIVTFINQAQSTRQLFASGVAAPLFEHVAQHVLINDHIV